MEACVMMLLETGMREEVSGCRRDDLPRFIIDGEVCRPLERQEAKERKPPAGLCSDASLMC